MRNERVKISHLLYDPVVRISTAAGRWKFGSVALTSVSLAILATASAVSMKTAAERSQNCMMEEHLSTLEAEEAHFTRARSLEEKLSPMSRFDSSFVLELAKSWFFVLVLLLN